MYRFFLSLVVVASLLFGMASADEVRSGHFTFDDWEGPALTVYYLEPPEAKMASAPVVIVMHGVQRNADDYAENWRELAAEYGLRIYAPEFSQRKFPGADMYNLGGIGTGKTGKRNKSSYAALEPLFATIQSRGETPRGYYLFGHSAGAQYVHRALLFEDLEHLEFAIAANAGWYTLPETGVEWPYGLGGTPADEADLKRWLGAPLIVMLGDKDIDPNDRNLRQTQEAQVQGPNRFTRGLFFLKVAQAKAKALETPYAWQGLSVPGVAHDNAGMAIAAAPVIAAHARAKENEQE